MINLWSQLAASSALAIMAIILHVLIRNDGNVSKLDPARYYTMVRERGDVPGARSLLDNDQNWLKESCRASLSVAYSANPSNECVQLRVALRNGILDKMKCLSYNSQVCSYLRLITSGIIKNVSTNVVGRSLSGLVPNSTTLNYRQLLLNAIDAAPYMFHNSYRAAQSDDLYVSRTILYNLVIFTILANMVVHFLDTYSMHWTRRLFTRLIVFVLSTMVSIFVFLNTSSGNTLTTVVGIWLPSLFILVYYEALLDHTISRPWYVHSTLSIHFFSLVLPRVLQDTPLHVLHHLFHREYPRIDREQRSELRHCRDGCRALPRCLDALPTGLLLLFPFCCIDLFVHSCCSRLSGIGSGTRRRSTRESGQRPHTRPSCTPRRRCSTPCTWPW